MKKKTTNEDIVNPITQRSYKVPLIHISMQQNLHFFHEKKKEENPMGREIHPIPSHGIFEEKNCPMGWDGMGWDGMGWDCPIPSGALVEYQ